MTAAVVLVTDYAWPDLDIERELLHPVGARVVVGTGLAPEAAAVMTNWARVGADLLDAAPHCVVVARYGVGVDNIDVARATELGILVTNVPDYCVDEVAEHTMALILASVRHVGELDRQTREGGWDNQATGPIHRLRGQTLGLIGYGQMGRAVAVRARAFGMTIATYGHRPATAAPPAPDLVLDSLDELLGACDVLSLHVPLTPRTAGLIGAAELARMKPTAFLVNTARGGVVDLAALSNALAAGTIRGAAVDVLPVEPAPAGWLRDRPANLLVTPHAAFYSVESVMDLQRRTASVVKQCLAGEVPPNVVNPAVLDSPRLRLGRR